MSVEDMSESAGALEPGMLIAEVVEDSCPGLMTTGADCEGAGVPRIMLLM